MNRSSYLLLAVFWAAIVVLGHPLYGHQKKEAVEVHISELKPTPAGVNVTLREPTRRKAFKC